MITEKLSLKINIENNEDINLENLKVNNIYVNEERQEIQINIDLISNYLKDYKEFDFKKRKIVNKKIKYIFKSNLVIFTNIKNKDLINLLNGKIETININTDFYDLSCKFINYNNIKHKVIDKSIINDLKNINYLENKMNDKIKKLKFSLNLFKKI